LSWESIMWTYLDFWIIWHHFSLQVK
jgi:hypothetical protein